MMHGVVNKNCEATIPIVIINEKRQTRLIDAVIDTNSSSRRRQTHN